MQTDYWQSFIVGTLGIAVTVIMAGLRPDFNNETNQPVQYEPSKPLKEIQPLLSTVHLPSAEKKHQPLTAVTEEPAIKENIPIPEPEELRLLNSLLLDYFTTDFNELSQAKWQQNLAMGSPFLSELADYLKLDQIYDLELNQIRNRSLSENFWRRYKSSETYNANIFNLFYDTNTTLWPLSLFTSKNLEKPVAKILLNHYDRAFLYKIETHNLATELRPLAKGIERLLTYHMRQAVYSQSTLKLSRHQNSIEDVVSAMVAELGSKADLFLFYQMAIEQKWESATKLLVQSDHLNQPSFLFLYDLVSSHKPDALMNLASFETISQQPTWWTEFLNYELCVSAENKDQNLFSIYLPVATPCPSNNENIGKIVKTKNSRASSLFIKNILQNNTLTEQDIQTFVTGLSANDFNDITAINSHTLLDQLAKEGKLKTLRSSQVFRAYEKNFQAWRQYMNFPNQDSFFYFSAVHHWYSNNRSKQQRSIDSEMPNIISQLSPHVQLRLSQSLLERYEAGLLTEKNWGYYKPLLKKLSHNELKKFQTLSQVVSWLSTSDTKTKTDSSNNTTITEQTFITVLMHDLHRTMDKANSLEDFLNRATITIRNHRLRSITVTENSMINNNGELSSSAIRQLKRIWRHNHL